MKPTTVKKPWGEEIWFAQTDKYAGKILIVKKGHRLSLQFHNNKSETQYLKSGMVKVTYGEGLDNLSETVLNPGDIFDVRPKLLHRIEALEDSEVIEVSTPELNDIVKISDDYGRTNEGNDFATDELIHDKNFNT